MMDLMPFVGQFGPPAIAALAVLGVLTGRLVPSRTYDRELKHREDQITIWREAYTNERARAELHAQQVDKLLELSETTVDIVKALPRAKEPL